MAPSFDPQKESIEHDATKEQSLLKSLYELTETIQKFQPTVTGLDQNWTFYLKSNNNWFHLNAKLYEDVWYFSSTTNSSRSCPYPTTERFSFSLTRGLDEEIIHNNYVHAIAPKLTASLKETYQKVVSDPIKHHAEISATLPPTMRKGLIPRVFVNSLLPEWMPFNEELTPVENHKMQQLCEKYDGYIHPKMTAAKYFEYCREAYLANSLNTSGTGFFSSRKKLGLELYHIFADGRDGGLTKLNPKSEEEFANWFDQKQFAGQHPWEIYRGGNSTHIDLYVQRARRGEDCGWQIVLSAFSSTRLAETCRIALALEAAGLPFELDHKESYLKRLRAEDLVGIIPDGCDLKYGYHDFPREFGVSDTIYFSFFKDSQGRQIKPWREIAKAVSWMPIKPMIPNCL